VRKFSNIKISADRIAKFHTQYSVDQKSGCWVWRGSMRRAYGVFHDHQQRISAHRASWFIHNGKIPKGKLVCHHCDNPICVNPSHLFLGTDTDNNQDKSKKGRARGNENKGEKANNVLLTECLVRKIRTSKLRPFEIAKKMGLKYGTVLSVIKRNNWRHVV